MRNTWIVLLGLAVAAGVAWWLQASAHERTDDTPAGDASPADPSTAPALQGAVTATEEAKATAPGQGRYRIHGQVVDEHDEPLPNVPIEVWRSKDRWPGQGYRAVVQSNDLRVRNRATALMAGVDKQEALVHETVSDADGRFDVRVKEAQYYSVYARPALPAVGGTARATLIPKASEVAEVTLRVFDGVPLRGKVVDGLGNPVAAQVRASHSRRGFGSWRAYTPSNAVTGTFAFDGVVNGKLSFAVTVASGRQYGGFSEKPPFADPVVLQIPDGSAAITGRVETDDEEPVAGALLTFRLEIGETKRRVAFVAKTDAEGRYEVEGLPAGFITRAGVTAAGFLGESFFGGRDGFASIPVVDDKAATWNITLRRGSAIEGRVTHKDEGTAIAGATVTLYFLGWHPPQEEITTTDDQGRYRFEQIDTGKFMVLASHPDHFVPEMEATLAQHTWSSNSKPPGHLQVQLTKMDQTVQRDLTLLPGVQLSGQVVDPDGKPAPGAGVFLQNHGLSGVGHRWGMMMPVQDVPNVVANDEGRFTLQGLSPRPDWVLFARKVGYAASYTEPVSLRDGPADGVVVRLVAQCVVRGRVVGAGGAPLADQRVFVGGMSTLRGGPYNFTTDADGRYEAHSLPAARLNISTRHGKLSVQVTVDDLTAGDVREGVDLVFGEQVEVTGTLRTSAGEPVPRVSISLYRRDGKQEFRSATTDAQGAFRIENVSPGRVQLYLRLGRSNTKEIGKPFDAPAKDLELVYDPPVEVQITGTVLGPDGKPIPIGKVTAYSENGRHPHATQLSNGSFRVTVKGGPPYTAWASQLKGADGTPLNLQSKTATVADPSQPVVIRLEAGVIVAGRVLDDEDKGLVGVKIETGSRSTQSDGTGSWRLIGLPPGRVGLTIKPPVGYLPAEPIIAEPGDADIVFRLTKGAEVVGRVLVPEGATLQGGSVIARWTRQGDIPAGSVRATLRHTGAFQVAGVPPDSPLSLTVEPYQPENARVRVAPKTIEGVKAGRTDVEITLEAGVSVSGVVLNPDGTPFTNGGVSLRDNGTGWGKTDKDGRFTISGLKPGRFKLLVFEGSQVLTDAIYVAAPTTDVRIELPDRAEISGKVVDVPQGQRWVVSVVDAASGKRPINMFKRPVAADGRWTIGPVDKAGTWVVLAHRDDGPSDRYAQSGGLAAGAKDVELRLKDGAEIRGRLARKTDPIAQTYVEIVGPGWSSGVMSDGDGNFHARGLPAGRYTLKANNWSLRLQGQLEDVATGTTGAVIEMKATR